MTNPVGGRPWIPWLAAAVCLLAVHGGASAAQRQAALLEGTVQDSTGAVVTNATVTVREPDTNLSRTTQTDSYGTFRISELPIGTYQMRVARDGFTPYT